MEYTKAHPNMNLVGQSLFPEQVPYVEAIPPDIQRGVRYWVGQLRRCGYCGSMHPTDVANAILAGAKGEWADMKYGYPHKAYFHGIPNPHAGIPEIIGHANYLVGGWIAMENGDSHSPPKPASDKTQGKFYTIHLQDATPQEKEIIEKNLGIHFEFIGNEKLRWSRID